MQRHIILVNTVLTAADLVKQLTPLENTTQTLPGCYVHIDA